jgi:hypothetical protein
MAGGRESIGKGGTHNGSRVSECSVRSQEIWWFEGGTEMEPTSGDLRFTSHRLSDICLASEKGDRHTSSVNKAHMAMAKPRHRVASFHFVSSCQPHFNLGPMATTPPHVDTARDTSSKHYLLSQAIPNTWILCAMRLHAVSIRRGRSDAATVPSPRTRSFTQEAHGHP